jgi:anti-sigma factor RsiW
MLRRLLFRRTCQEAARLITARLDRPLPWAERAALRLHLAACDRCPRFERQMRLMQSAMGRWRAYGDKEAA